MTKGSFLPVTDSGDRGFVFDEPGRHVVFFHNISGNLKFEINAPGVELYIYGLYTGTGHDRFQLTTLQMHNAPSSLSNLYVKGIFEDSSQFLYQGLIRIEKNGSGSHAYQKNQNLILSDKVFVSSKPDLEILARDVFCTHGSTTGRLNRKQLFYLASRGLDEKEGQKLLVAGFIQHLLTQLSALGFAKEAVRYQTLLLPEYA